MRVLAKTIGVVAGIVVWLLVMWLAISYAAYLANDYRSSILRDTVAAMKENGK